jgi:hypothetical protein
MRTQVMTAAAVLMLCALGNASAKTTSARTPGNALPDDERSPSVPIPPRLAGVWKSAPDQVKLTSDFDKSVWGPDATSVRAVDLTIRPSGEGTLTVTRKVVDGRGRAIPASTSIEEARLVVGAPQEKFGPRVEHSVKVLSAERRHPDDPGYRWPLEGLKVKVVTFDDGDGNTIEIRFDTPEGRGSFWETLRRESRSTSRRASP